MLKTLRSEFDALGSIIRMATLAAVAGALYQELRRPPEERTWHGQLMGFVPYDFRVPTPAKVINAVWNPKSEQVFGDPIFGVGWSVNVAAVADRLGKLQAATHRSSSSTRKRTKS